MGRERGGILISFEGIEKVGKTTQIGRLSAWLGAQGFTPRVLREPGGTMLGESLRSLLLHSGEIKNPEAELLLFAAARAELVTEVIRPSLSRGEIVILDRFADSSVAYQGFGRGIDVKWIRILNQHVTEGLRPDITFLLQGPSFYHGDDNIEKSGQEFFQRVEAGYNTMVAEDPSRWHVIPSARPIDEVAKVIQSVVKSYLVEDRSRRG